MSTKTLSKAGMIGLVPVIALAIMAVFPSNSIAQETVNSSSSGECTTCDLASIDANAKPTVKIRWKRLVDSTGKTATIHAATEQGIDAAVKSLKASLEPLGVEVVLQKADMTKEQFAETPLNSNRIWLNGKLLETYLPETKTGQVQDKKSTAVFRTVNFGGTSFKDLPAKMIEHAGVIAAADSMKETMADLHVIGLVKSKGKSCCETAGGASCTEGGKSCCPDGKSNTCCEANAKQPAVKKK